MEFVGDLAGMRARQSMEKSIKNAADSVYIVTEGTKRTYSVAKSMSETTNAGADAIRKLTRENSTRLVDRSSDLGKNIVGKSWDIATALFRAWWVEPIARSAWLGARGEPIVQGASDETG